MKAKWTLVLAAFFLGFSAAWIIQGFRIGHMENEAIAHDVGEIYQAQMKRLEE